MESCAREFYLPGEAEVPWYVDFLCCNKKSRPRFSGHNRQIPAPRASYSKFASEDTSTTRVFETELPSLKEPSKPTCPCWKWMTLITGVLFIFIGLAAWGYENSQNSHSVPGQDGQHTSIAHARSRPNHPHAAAGPDALLVATPATTSNAVFPAVVAIAKTTTTTTTPAAVPGRSIPLKTAIVAATNSSTTTSGTSTQSSTGTSTATSMISSTTTSITTTSSTTIWCRACAPKKRDVPDVVIPFYERDLCKLQYTVEALRLHAAKKFLGTIFLVWVSTHQSFDYSGPLSAMNQTLSMTRNVHILDLSPQVVKLQGTGWVVQQIMKLKIASIISSEYYVVLDSKNALIQDVPYDLFLTPCNQGRVWGEFRYNKIPEPHGHWYRESARALKLSAPASGYWPSSSTPMVLHKRTVLKMLSTIGESPHFDPICDGPLCDLLGLKGGDGATEFTLYMVFARSQHDFECIHSLATPGISDLAQQWSLSLWRGLGTYKNRQRLKQIVNGRQKPFMFGAQPGVLDGVSHAHRNEIVADLVTIYTDAELYDPSLSEDDFIECIIGEDGTKKKKKAKLDMMPEFTFEHEFCCTGSESKHDVCGTCWSGAVAKPGDFCAESESSCHKCHKTWCKPRAKFRDWTGTLIM